MTLEYENSPAAPAAQVVIVDDSDDAALSLTMLFDLEGISTATAADAESALTLIERTLPALCLIDIGLPGISGTELAQRLRAMPATRAITLIALTGREAGLDAQSRSQAQVFDQYWTKPFDPKRLIAEVQAVIARAGSGG
jgi:two-component system CheB/CheR fusion protein